MILIKNYFDKEFCKGIINYGEEKGFMKATVGNDDNEPNVDEDVRISQVHFVEWPVYNSPFIHDLYFNLNMKLLEVNDHMYNFELSSFEPLQITKYEGETKGFYDWHMDVRNNGFRSDRKLSLSVLLNDSDEFEGGEFEFKAPFEDRLAQAGDLLIFPSWEEHCVKPVTKGIRYSLVGWMRGPLMK